MKIGTKLLNQFLGESGVETFRNGTCDFDRPFQIGKYVYFTDQKVVLRFEAAKLKWRGRKSKRFPPADQMLFYDKLKGRPWPKATYGKSHVALWMGGHCVAKHYHHLISKLPRVRWLKAKQPNPQTPILFTFTGGCGMVMGMNAETVLSLGGSIAGKRPR